MAVFHNLYFKNPDGKKFLMAIIQDQIDYYLHIIKDC